MSLFHRYRLHRRASKQKKNEHRSSLPMTSSKSLNGSNSSLSSLITSFRDFSVMLNHGLLKRETSCGSDKLSKRNSIEHTSVCQVCNQFNSSSQYDLCSRCRQNQTVTRSESLPETSTESNMENGTAKSSIFYIGSVSDKYEDLRNVHKNNNHLHRQCLIHLANSYRLQQSSTKSLMTSSDLSLAQLCLQPTLSLERKVNEKKSSLPRITDSPSIFFSPARIAHYKQRQIELDRSVEKLLEGLVIKTKENISEISKHWCYLKQLSLREYRPHTTHLQLFGSIIETSSSNKQSQSYLEEHDEVQAAFQILLRILTVFHERYSLLSIHQLFDTIEKTMLENLHSQLESLISSYKDELSFVRERIHFYQTRINSDKNFEWIQCIKVDYPILIENISNDFIIRVPQIEQILTQMLRNTKKSLLNFVIEKMQ